MPNVNGSGAAASASAAIPGTPSTLAISCGSAATAVVPCGSTVRTNSSIHSLVGSRCMWASTNEGVSAAPATSTCSCASRSPQPATKPSATARAVSTHSLVAGLNTRPPVMRRSAGSSPRATAMALGVACGRATLAALDRGLDQAERLRGGVEHLAAVLDAEAGHVEREVVAVRQGEADALDLGVRLEHRLAHAVQRELDRGAVVVCENVEEAVAHSLPCGLVVTAPVAVLPARRDRRSEDAVVGLGERGEAVAVEALEGRAGRAQYEQVLDAGGAAHPAPIGPNLLDAGGAGAALPGVRVAAGQALPGVLAQAGERAGHARIREEVLREGACEGWQRVERALGGERVNDVAHRVGGDQAGVVALGVDGIEVALEHHVDGEVEGE